MSGRAVAGGSAVGFSAGWNIADTGAVADDLADAYGTSLGVIGLFTAVLFLTHLLMQLPAGRLSDRLGPARVCAAGLAVMAIGNVLASIAPEPALAIGVRALLGVGTALGFIGGSDFVRASKGSPFAQGLYGGLATATTTAVRYGVRTSRVRRPTGRHCSPSHAMARSCGSRSSSPPRSG